MTQQLNEIESSLLKTCKVCLDEKPHASYYSNSRCKDGLESRCKECRKEARADLVGPPVPRKRKKARNRKWAETRKISTRKKRYKKEIEELNLEASRAAISGNHFQSLTAILLRDKLKKKLQALG